MGATGPHLERPVSPSLALGPLYKMVNSQAYPTGMRAARRAERSTHKSPDWQKFRSILTRWPPPDSTPTVSTRYTHSAPKEVPVDPYNKSQVMPASTRGGANPGRGAGANQPSGGPPVPPRGGANPPTVQDLAAQIQAQAATITQLYRLI